MNAFQRLRQVLVPVFCLLGLCVAPAVKADQVDAIVHEQMQKTRIPGVAVVVLRDGRIKKQKAFGLANVDANLPTALKSVFPLASVTKVFTATAVFMLVEDGKLRLDDRITTLISELPDAWKDITVLNCLTHTSGLADLATGGAAIANSEKEALTKLATMSKVFATGQKSSYIQTGFLVLKKIIEIKSGMKFEDFLMKRIFEPSKIKSARFGDSRDVIPNRVELYHRWVWQADGRRTISPDKLFHDSASYPEYWHGGVGLNMSAADFAKFDIALMSGRLLKPETLRQMWTPYILSDGKTGEFAAGWQASSANGHRVVLMIGAGRVCYAHLVDDGFSVIWLTNGRGGSDVLEAVYDILNFYAPGIAKLKQRFNRTTRWTEAQGARFST